MKETILDLPRISQRCDDLEVARWQFQSGKGPFQETDPAKWTWQNYSDDESLIIEEAYLLKQEAVHLEDYELDLKKMIQVSKQDKNKIRRVRRQEPSRFLMKMPEAKVIMKDQKTMNEAFGTVQHFLEYIMKRTPEAYTLYQKLRKLSLDCDYAEFHSLVDEVKVCIEKGAEARERIIKTRAGSRHTPNYILEAQKIMSMIENNSQTLRGFLKAILKVYTMETFICYWLNELLRTEGWEEVNVLTPYLVCLIYTFKLPDYVLKEQSSQKAINDQLGFVVKHKLYLYRGAALTEEQLVSYNPNKIKYFSWNAVTSTSRERNVARNFVDLSLSSRTNIGVIFFIEVDFDSLEDYHGMIDISKDSKYPKEQEVILAPGTMFKLLEISLIENDIYEIRLKIKKNIDEAEEDVALLGILQEQAISKDKATIDGLPSQKGFRMLELLRGNKLIRKLEIRDSGIEKHILEEIESVRLTTNVRKEDMKLVGNVIITSSLKALAHDYSLNNLNDILMLNQVRFRCEIVKNSPQIAEGFRIENLILKDKTIEMFRCNDQLKELWRGLKTESQILGISLSIQKLQIQENELSDFFECFKEWKSLEGLSLTLNETQTISIENFDSFCQVISSSKKLNRLSLKLPFSDERLSLLGNTLIFLPSLQNLSLQFQGYHKISDEGLSFLTKAITSFTSLEDLHFCFKECNSISDEGLNSLKSGLISLKTLNHLSWKFFNCNRISIVGLTYLMSVSRFSTSLEHLSDDASSLSQASNEEDENDRESFNKLSQHASLLFSKHISLDLRFCKQITGQNLQDFQKTLTSLSLESDLRLKLYNSECDFEVSYLTLTLISLRSLQHLSLKFGPCWSLSDFGFDSLNHALESLTSLRHLSLNFGENIEISNDGLNSFSCALISLTSLQHLSLDFGCFNKVSDVGLNYLQNGLISLKSLQHLSLDFGYYSQISFVGLNYLKSALISLIHLQHLSLSFGDCIEISNNGLNSLSCALISLTSLQHLSLDFGRCNKVSDLGLNYLQNGLISLKSLQHLSLNFRRCGIISDSKFDSFDIESCINSYFQELAADFGDSKRISDAGLNHLKSALASLTFLKHLSLNFGYCSYLSNDGLNSLSCALISLTSLQHLSLDFRACSRISNTGLENLSNVLVSLISLKHLSLNFHRDCIISDIKSFEGFLQQSSIGLSDVGFKYLSCALAQLASLQHLSLDFGGCNKVSDVGLNYLHNGLIPLASLQRLSLNFTDCSQISDDGLNYLNSGLISLRSLQYLRLQLFNCSRISSERVEHLRIELKSIASLTIIKEIDILSMISVD